MTDLNPALRRETIKGLSDLVPSRLNRIRVYVAYMGKRIMLANEEAYLAFHLDPHEFSEARSRNTEKLQAAMGREILERM